MKLKIKDKSDYDSVEKIINLGYPGNREYLVELLSWAEDPNWPIAGTIYEFFRKLGLHGVETVLGYARQTDADTRYNLIVQIISAYPPETLTACTDDLVRWAKQTGGEECDFEALRILCDHELIELPEIAKIAKRNLFVYNVWIRETLEAAGKAIYAEPLGKHHL